MRVLLPVTLLAVLLCVSATFSEARLYASSSPKKGKNQEGHRVSLTQRSPPQSREEARARLASAKVHAAARLHRFHEIAAANGLGPSPGKFDPTSVTTPGSSRGTTPLLNDHGIEFSANVSFGTPPQMLLLQMDTGSANLWTIGTSCNNYTNSPACKGQARFNSSASSTWNASTCTVPKNAHPNCVVNVSYGDGSDGVIGPIGQDVVSIAGIELPATTNLGVVYSEYGPISDWTPKHSSGILGLAYPTLARPRGMLTPVDVMIQQKLIKDPVFAFYLDRQRQETNPRTGGFASYNKSYISFGHVPTENYEGELIAVDQSSLQPMFGFWVIDVSAVKVGGVTIPGTSNIHAVVDSGTSGIMGPGYIVNQFINNITIADGSSNCSGLAMLPNLTFTANLGKGKGTHDFTLTPEDYYQTFSDVYSYPNTWCEQPGVQEGQIGPSYLNGWILGDTFIKAFFTVFDRGTNQVKFARSKQPSP